MSVAGPEWFKGEVFEILVPHSWCCLGGGHRTIRRWSLATGSGEQSLKGISASGSSQTSLHPDPTKIQHRLLLPWMGSDPTPTPVLSDSCARISPTSLMRLLSSISSHRNEKVSDTHYTGHWHIQTLYIASCNPHPPSKS